MMYHRLVSLFGSIIIVLWGQTALAAAVMLNPESPNVEAGAEFNVEFFLDTSGTLGPHPGNYCGEVRIEYDPTLLSFVAADGALQELDNSRETLADGSEAISFSFKDVIFDTNPDAGAVGNFIFTANTGLNGTATIGIEDNLALGSFFNHADPVTGNPNITGDPSEFFVAPATATVQVVPLPAAAWLFLGALGGLGLVGRKSRAANRIT